MGIPTLITHKTSIELRVTFSRTMWPPGFGALAIRTDSLVSSEYGTDTSMVEDSLTAPIHNWRGTKQASNWMQSFSFFQYKKECKNVGFGDNLLANSLLPCSRVKLQEPFAR